MTDQSFGAGSDGDGYDMTGCSGSVAIDDVRNYIAALRRNGEFDRTEVYAKCRELWARAKMSTETLGAAVAELKMGAEKRFERTRHGR